MGRKDIEKKIITGSGAPYRIWGKNPDQDAVIQMDQACSLPVSVKGALMPDAHKGYGLPIGGVLAVDNAVIPYAVGVDIACRMCMTILDIPFPELENNRGRFKMALERETLFGVGAEFSKPRTHEVMDLDWGFAPLVESMKDKAWRQLGTSGSGNHFAEFGKLTLYEKEKLCLTGRNSINCEPLEPGEYLAFLTHSGSRGTGAEIAAHYSRVAKLAHPELPSELQNLAWLDMGRADAEEYWAAMELMGRYSAANHDIIHNSVIRALGVDSLAQLSNHHNFAWKMEIEKKIAGARESQSQKVIVHRKGATPAGKGVVGIIPGSMASPGFIVRGLGNPESLESAAHGAGRRMSRTAAIKQFKRGDLDSLMKQRGVTLLSAGLDEVPMAYKDIEKVMSHQQDLVSIIARFDPKLVKMAPPERRRQKNGR